MNKEYVVGMRRHGIFRCIVASRSRWGRVLSSFFNILGENQEARASGPGNLNVTVIILYNISKTSLYPPPRLETRSGQT